MTYRDHSAGQDAGSVLHPAVDAVVLRPDVSELAAAVVDGMTIDWQEVESGATHDVLPVVKALRDLDTILEAHRDVLTRESSRRRRPPPLEPGATWSHLRVVRFLGGGGFGDVYEAIDPRIERPTALKLLDAAGACDEALLQEARLLAKISHPNVVKVYSADRVDGCVGISMELLEGHTLTDELAQFGTMGADDAMVIGMKLCDALAEVHRQGIVHRDVKAQNVMRARGGRVVLMDFGIGLEADSEDEARPAGTPAYLAPEVLAGGTPGVHSDLYAVGVLLFHLVTADFPVRGRTLEEYRRRHETGEVNHLRDLRPGLPEAFVRVVEKALEPDLERRFNSAGAFHRALSQAMEESILGRQRGRTTKRSRSAFLAGAGWAALLLAILGAATWFVAPPRLHEPPPETLVLVGPVDDGAIDGAFAGTAEAVLRSALRDSEAFEPLTRDAERQVSRRMRRVDAMASFESDEIVEAALRSGASGIVSGELVEASDGWGLSLRVVPTVEPGAQEVVHWNMPNLTTASLEDAVGKAVQRLTESSSAWRATGGLLDPIRLPRLERATTHSSDALRRYSEGLQEYQDGQIEASEAKLRAAVSIDPEFSLAHLHLGHSLSAKGDQEGALDHFQRAFDLREESASELEKWTVEAAYHAAFRQYVPAIAAYEQVLDHVASEPSVRRQLALAHQEVGQHEKAIANARLGLEDSLNHGLLVYVLSVAGQPSAAMDEAAGIRREFGVTPYLLWSEGFALLELERLEEALATLRELAGTAEDVYSNLASWLEARIHLFAGDLETASKVLYRDRGTDAVEGSDFLEIRRRYWTARLQALRGQRHHAIADLRNLDLVTIPAQLTSWRSVGTLQAELGDIEGAERTLARLWSIHRSHPGLISEMVTTQVRAEIHLANDEPASAVEALRAGGGLADVSFVRTSIRAHLALGELEEAVFLGERFLERKGEVLDREFVGLWVEAHYRQARLLERLGRRAEAERHFAEARKFWGDLADRSFGADAPSDVLPEGP